MSDKENKERRSTWKRKKDGKGYFHLFRPLSPVKVREHKKRCLEVSGVFKEREKNG